MYNKKEERNKDMYKNGNWEVGDIVKVKSTDQSVVGDFYGKSYEVIQIPTTYLEDDRILALRNVMNKNELQNYYRFPLELDMNYYRSKKLKKICTKLGMY